MLLLLTLVVGGGLLLFWASSSSAALFSSGPSASVGPPDMPPTPATPETSTDFGGLGLGFDPYGANAGKPVPAPVGPTRRMTGPAGSLPQWEQDKIFAACDGYGIDPTFVAAIRLSENGGPGREFG